MAIKINYEGWILKQLTIQANSLFADLDKVWKDIKDSKWLGGSSEGWERFPYYLNGLVPLAYTLNDFKLIDKANYYINKVFLCQKDDGNISPNACENSKDIWPLFLILKVICIYHYYSNDKKALIVIEKALEFIDKYLENDKLIDWAKARYYECFIPILYLLKHNISNKDFLISLAKKLNDSGFDYLSLSKNWNKVSKYWCLENHGVNISMALKANELYKQITGIDTGISCKEMLKILDKYHGNSYKHFNVDECLSGKGSYQGSELCSIVEAMYSYELLFSLTDDTYYLDRLEFLAYNGLAATLKDDMNAHQYDQQVNQIACYPFKKKVIFKTNINEANVFGLEPNYGCCTANFGQGWPLFAMHAFSIKDDMIQINIPLKATITHKDIILKIDSEYPFNNKITLLSNKDIKVNIRKGYGYEFKTIYLKANVNRTMYVKYEVKINKSLDNLYYLTYGPLLFTLPIKYRCEIKEYSKNDVIRKYPYCDYYYYPIEDFQYAFVSNKFKLIKKDFDNPFDRNNSALIIKTKMVKVKQNHKKGYEYVFNNKIESISNKKVYKEFVLYGASYLRVTNMNKLK